MVAICQCLGLLFVKGKGGLQFVINVYFSVVLCVGLCGADNTWYVLDCVREKVRLLIPKKLFLLLAVANITRITLKMGIVEEYIVIIV